MQLYMSVQHAGHFFLFFFVVVQSVGHFLSSVRCCNVHHKYRSMCRTENGISRAQREVVGSAGVNKAAGCSRQSSTSRVTSEWPLRRISPF